MRWEVVIKDVEGNEITPRMRYWLRRNAEAEARRLNNRGKSMAFVAQGLVTAETASKLADQMYYAKVVRA